MDDACFVCGFERTRDLLGDVEGLHDRHRAAGERRLQRVRAVETYNRDVREMFAQRQAERSADQAGSEDGHA